MAYNINLANYINNTSNTGVNGVLGENAQSQPVREASQAARDTSELIKGMLVGDVFTGEVLSVDENSVSIRTNGKLLMANLMQETGQLSKGDMLTFLVSDKADNKISLKTLDTPAQEALFAGKALYESGLAVNQANLDMVKGLIDQNMPIDKNTLNDLAKIMNAFPDADTDTLTRLYKLDMPINDENIKQFDAYKVYEHDMTGTINNLAEDFSGIIDKLVGEGSDSKAVQLTQDMLSLLSQEAVEEEINTPERTVSDEGGIPQADAALKEVPEGNTVKEEILKEEVLKETPKETLKDVTSYLKNENIPDKEKNNLLQKFLSDEDIPVEIKSKITSSEEFKDFFQKQLKNTLFIKPEDVSDKGEVKDFYKKLLKVTSDGERLLEREGLENSNMAKGMHSVKSNVEFMNDLNHQMAYLQIPIKLQDGEARGDLYVYTNKKALKGKSDELTALLHLDMNNLGPMDIYIKMSNGNNVSTNFCLESEEMLDFIYEHIDILTERLNKKGYNFKPTMTVKNPDENEKSGGKIDFEKDFLDVVEPVIPISRYLFDTKA